MKKLKYRLIYLGLIFTMLVMSALFLGGCGQNEAPGDASDNIVKIGIIDTYSGPAAGYAEHSLAGLKLALDEAKKDGDSDFEFQLITRDSEFQVDKGLEWARELVEREQVDILVGTINSSVALAVSEYAKEKKVPFLVWNAQSQKITGEKGHRYVFGMMPNATMSGRTGAVVMKEKPFTKYWLAGSDYEYGHAIVDSFWSSLKEAKPDVEKVGESWWPVREADLTPYFNAIKMSKPEVLVIGAGGADMIPVMKTIAATGLNEEMEIWIHTGTDLATLSPLGAEAPENVMGTATYHYYYPDTPENKAFVESFRAANDMDPGFTSLNGYVTGLFITKGLKQVGQMNREEFVDALEGLSVDGPIGEIKLREYDHQVIAPIFFGVTGKADGNPYLISKDIITVEGQDIAVPIEEIKNLRNQ